MYQRGAHLYMKDAEPVSAWPEWYVEYPSFTLLLLCPLTPNLPEASLPNESESVGCPGGSDSKNLLAMQEI